jgi:hypothetical protein
MLPELNLWRAVVKQAYKDAVSPKRLDDDTPLRMIQRDALRFLSEFAPEWYKKALVEGAKF